MVMPTSSEDKRTSMSISHEAVPNNSPVAMSSLILHGNQHHWEKAFKIIASSANTYA